LYHCEIIKFCFETGRERDERAGGGGCTKDECCFAGEQQETFGKPILCFY
jgi:hypothetical protein